MTKRNDRPSGWRCSIRHQEAQVNYYRSTKGFRTEAMYQLRKEQDAS